jgi:uncharacterized membrane protein YraQ (UPF0718 family)
MKNISRKKPKAGRGGWIFLAIVLLLYAVIGILDAELVVQAMSSFGQLLEQVLPILLLVFGLIFVINLLLQGAWVTKHLGSQSGLRGWITAIIGGVLSSGPVYPWYALVGDLRSKGMSISLAAAFLYSRSVKLPLLPLLLHYFGAAYTLVLVTYLLVFSVINGFVMGRLCRD